MCVLISVCVCAAATTADDEAKEGQKKIKQGKTEKEKEEKKEEDVAQGECWSTVPLFALAKACCAVCIPVTASCDPLARYGAPALVFQGACADVSCEGQRQCLAPISSCCGLAWQVQQHLTQPRQVPGSLLHSQCPLLLRPQERTGHSSKGTTKFWCAFVPVRLLVLPCCHQKTFAVGKIVGFQTCNLSVCTICWSVAPKVVNSVPAFPTALMSINTQLEKPKVQHHCRKVRTPTHSAHIGIFCCRQILGPLAVRF